jgi:ABC-type molybdate transport system ATPase subunit
MDKIIPKEKILFNNRHNNIFYFVENKKLFRGKGNRIFQNGSLYYKLKIKKEVTYGLLTQNEEIKKIVSDFGLPIIHHRNRFKFE